MEGAYLGLGGQTHIHYMGTTPMRHPSLCVPAQQPSNRVLARGDVLITEISAHYHGYPGQILRPFTIGEPPTPAYQRLYDVAVGTFWRIAAMVRRRRRRRGVDAAEGIRGRVPRSAGDLAHGFGGGTATSRPHATNRHEQPRDHAAEDMTIVIQPTSSRRREQMGLQVGEPVTSRGQESNRCIAIMRFIRR